MELVFIGLEALGCLFIWGFVFLFHRNESVYKYRKRVINEIHQKCSTEIQSLYKKIEATGDTTLEEDFNWKWRYDEFSKVSYNEMTFKFWRPCSFFFAKTKLEKDMYIFEERTKMRLRDIFKKRVDLGSTIDKVIENRKKVLHKK